MPSPRLQAITFLVMSFPLFAAETPPTGGITLTSSSPSLEKGFAGARSTALGKVHPDNGGCFQAALQDRGGYCQRDFVHQIDGAALLGLQRESLAMLRCFARHQTQARGWFTLWEINYDGTPMVCDYRDDTQFWRNTAGMFDLVHGAFRLHRWTGNSELVQDPLLVGFYSRIVNEFVAGHDRDGNGIVDAAASNGWGIACTYNELPGVVLAESADSLGTQRRAFEAYAQVLRARGDPAGAQAWTAKAERLKRTFNDTWFDAAANRYRIGYDHPGRRPVSSFGYETSWFIPYTELCEPGPRASAYLDFIHDSFQARPSGNIEAWTYLPDVFYAWGQNERGWQYFKRVLDSRSGYPEVSFTVVSHLATRIMGIEPDAPRRSVRTLGRLPAEVAWVQLDHVPVGGNDLLVRHEDGNRSTTVANHAGPDITWEALFPGTHAVIQVDGVPVTAAARSLNGVPVSGVSVTLKAGQRRVAAVPEPPLTGLVVLLRFKEQEKLQLPPADFVSQAINQQISDFYGHVTNWKVRPMTFIVSDYFAPAKGFTAYDWWSNGNWENHFTLLREVSAGLARGTILAKAKSGKLEPVDLSVLSRSADGRILSAGTTYFVDAAGSGGVFGRANGNDAFWPQEREVADAIARKFQCRLASYSSGFVVGTYGRTDRPEEVDVGAQIHEIGHAFLGWPDIDSQCHGYGNDWEIVKRISTRNKSGPSAAIRDCSRLPGGSTIQVSVGDWDVWGVQNPGNPGEYIVFENVCAKGYTYAFAKDHPRLNLLCYRIDTCKQTQVNVPDLAKATWADGRPVGFSIKDVSPPDDVMSLTLVSDVSGKPRKEGTAGGVKGYPVELFEQPGLQGPIGAFGAGQYYASWMPRMGMKPRAASSIRLQPGFRVTLYDGPRLQGATCVLLNTGSPPLAVDLATKGFDRKTASLLVEALPAAPGKP